MKFELESNQKLIQEMVREFALKELVEKAVEIDENRKFPWDSIKKMAGLGLLGMITPEAYGGSGMDYLSLAIAVEEISHACASTGVIVAVNHTLAAYPILEFGNDAQKKKYLPLLAKAEKLGAFALTEANAGSDPASMETTAVLKGDHYILNGSKRFITNGGEAGIFIVFAYTDVEKKHKGISAFIIEKGTPGFSIGEHEDLLGLRATANCELIFDECKVAKENILGEEGQGFKIALNTIDTSRIDIGAQSVGIAQASLDAAVQYSKERKTFGKPICEYEMIQAKLAEMASRIDAARLLVYRAAAIKDNGGKKYTKEAAMAKYMASEAVMYSVREAVQIYGGYGYTKDYPVERFYRDAKVMEIYEGTSEIQKIVIARHLLG
jgi:butyryl-CoA dehydrogenase